MSRIVPFDISYKRIDFIDLLSFIFLLISASSIIVKWTYIIFFEKQHPIIKDDLLNVTLNVSNSFMLFYLVLNLFIKIRFHLLENNRRVDLFDNSFGSTLSDDNTVGYFNNEEMSLGMKKLALNTYESSYHTEGTLSKMLERKLYLYIPLLMIFIISIISNGGKGLIRFAIEISVPIIILSQYVILIFYYLGVKKVNNLFRTVLDNIGHKNLRKDDVPKLLRLIMEYNTTQAWANTHLNSSIFHKNNERVSNKWNEIKERYI
ncbi:hypothetical protein [Flammeovirga kamogawensis]|uniref:Uncharacterized protein n=1 Tax=Flammeovirga kamogawensis TaxID=373891 RepID=A0ABX8GT59_9BACT|nr:hypothetical protein [Flammeovirga kamogawensis]MBB6463327.1 hypothetical protein [Flammeovirga kamogawensis]QWG06701.1 hypothetical protein KM029_15500 [Flammeovirga kamogawensis]TRX68522.1 hypothetical protein EO216_10495 [Flammeovirga kamogawensis]